MVAYDLRPFLAAVEVRGHPDGGVEIVMKLRHDPEKGVGRPEEVLAELSDRSGVSLERASLVRDRLVLAPERTAAPSAQPAPGRARRMPQAAAASSRRDRK